jgi:hypothetical protein
MFDALVEPRGNAFVSSNTSDFIDTRNGLGDLRAFGQEKINDVLFPLLGSSDLMRLCCTSRALWTLIEADEALWREVVLSELAESELEARILQLSPRLRKRNMWKLLGTNRLEGK